MGEWMTVPAGERVALQAEVRPNLLGRAIAFVLRAVPVLIEVEFTDNGAATYRTVRANLVSGPVAGVGWPVICFCTAAGRGRPARVWRPAPHWGPLIKQDRTSRCPALLLVLLGCRIWGIGASRSLRSGAGFLPGCYRLGSRRSGVRA
jgi:hypothetical protein